MQNWDHMCADCHSTNLRKEFDDSSQTFSTAYSEINVACESCHGPGREHVELARANQGWDGVTHFGLADVNSSNVAQIESCAKCHARRGFVHPGHHANDSFLDHFLPEVVQPWSPDMQVPTYHVDGQIDDEVYVYGSYVRVKCFIKESVVWIAMTLIPLNCTPTPISFVPVVMFLMKIILLGLIPRTIIFINQAHKEPNVSNVICPTRHTWGLMIDGIIAYEYPGLIIP